MIYTARQFMDGEGRPGSVRDAVYLGGSWDAGGADWRRGAVRALMAAGMDAADFIVPMNDCRDDGDSFGKGLVFRHLALRLSSANVFWFGDGGGPGIDALVELGGWLDAPGTFVGYDPEFANAATADVEARCALAGVECHRSLDSLCDAVARHFDHSPRTYFISDTHFSQVKQLWVWKRPFNSVLNMDLEMISKWNKTVHSQDVVYHLGDFGEPYALSLLNFGEMKFVNGNYENKGKVDMGPAFEEDGRVEVIPSGSVCEIDGSEYRLCHEPCPDGGSSDDGEFWLYGHIHSSQRIKRNGVNVGADCNGYWPLPATEVERLRMQVSNFADENCFCEWVNGRED